MRAVNFERKLENIIASDDPKNIWLPLLILLRLLAFIYGIAVDIRNFLYDRGLISSKELVPAVLSIGNISVGGTGKTPTVMKLASTLKAKGYEPAVISRGYGREISEPLLVNDGEKIRADPEDCGDEAYLLASRLEKIPVVACNNKTEAASWAAENLSADIILIDDGFQHRSLARDFDLVLLDATNPFGHGHLLPRGLLREDPKSLKRADGILITRADKVDSDKILEIIERIRNIKPDIPLGLTRYKPVSIRDSAGRNYGTDMLKGKKIAAFSGIGNHEAFLSTLQGLGAVIVGETAFSDHQDYKKEDFCELFSKGDEDAISVSADNSSEMVVTTSKDLARMTSEIVDYFQEQNINLLAVEGEIEFIYDGLDKKHDNLKGNILSDIERTVKREQTGGNR